MSTKTRQRRRYTDEFKRQVVAESFDPEVSVAEIARRYEMNANALFNWRKDPRFNPALAEREPHLPARSRRAGRLAPAQLRDLRPTPC
ncbi:MAG: transposase [Maricaulis sp.]|uniref:transposase n=1 Tax=Maricaulis sp. TaxID=1486257 RepID=UPI001B129514|nr:transposase [Maricaulis sp.]MBO6730869.1 transposase [Maricaulis sp.]MBO6878871.1 transposase [Maricaulis sp.]